MKVQGLSKNELLDYIHSDEFASAQVIPISFHRALSHIHNPSATESDKLLFIVKEKEELIGYIGVLPIQYQHENELKKAGFLSCLWVNPAHRGKKIAQNLLNEAYTSWNGALFVTEFTREAKRLYDKSTYFQDLIFLEGLRCYVFFELSRILPPKHLFFQKSWFLLRGVDACVNALLSPKRWFQKEKSYVNRLEEIEHITEELSAFIFLKSKENLFYRNKHELNWIHDFPWLKNKNEDQGEAKKYHFSSYSNRFINLQFSFRNEFNQIIAYVMLNVRDFQLKTCYIYMDEEAKMDVLFLIQNCIRKYNIKTVTTFHSDLISLIEKKSIGAVWKKKIHRHFIVSKHVHVTLNRNPIQDGDADCCFT